MQEYILELSKYGITILISIYVLTCYLSFRLKEGQGNGLYFFQVFLIFCIQILGFLDLVFAADDYQYFIYFAFVQVFLFMLVTLAPLIYDHLNRQLLNNMALLLSVGLMMLARLSVGKFERQFVICLISFGISLLVPYLLSKIRFLKKMLAAYASIGILMLSIVLIMGEVTHGSKITFSISGITFQPSEFVKILFLFFLAAALWENVSLQRIALTSLLAAVHVLILVVSKDLGGALLFFVTYLFVLFVATGSYLYLGAGLFAGSIAAVVAYQLFDHIRVRVLAWQNPWDYIDNQGYQITQSLFAIGGGKWFGMGLMQGNPKAIPYVEADFIFSSICEELGVIFGICLILICLNCFLIILYTALRIHDRFYRLIVYGIGIIYAFQIFLTIGGGVKFIPLTGVTLPFISYGGSSVMTTMLMFFIVQGLHIRLYQEEVVRNE